MNRSSYGFDKIVSIGDINGFLSIDREFLPSGVKICLKIILILFALKALPVLQSLGASQVSIDL